MRSKIARTLPIALLLFTLFGDAHAQTPDMPTSSSSVDPALKDLADKLNQAFGSPIFTASNVWDEDADTVGARLGWLKDSDSSYRRLDLRQASQLHFEGAPKSDNTLGSSDTPTPVETDVTLDHNGKTLINCLGSHAYSSALYIRNGKPDFISIIFANNGDISIENHANIDWKTIQATDGGINTPAALANATKMAHDAIEREYPFLHAQLTAILGDPSACSYGGAGDNDAHSDRWDWNGTSILLCHIPDHLVAITLCPIAFADSRGLRPNYNVGNVQANLLTNIVKSPNGDVLLKGVPALSQGNKGYCVPATCEQFFRYLDIPCDMYFFAVVLQTGQGGNTNSNNEIPALNTYLDPYGLQAKSIDAATSIENFAPYIDKGEPVLWGCSMGSPIDQQVNSRVNLRVAPNWQKYLAKVEADKAATKTIDMAAFIKAHPDCGHNRIIVGYNTSLQELAFTDTNVSRGKNLIRWITVDEAQAIAQGDNIVVEPEQ
jgi:hypothetical protein